MTSKLHVRIDALIFIIIYGLTILGCSVILRNRYEFQSWLHIYILIDILLLVLQTIITKKLYKSLLQIEYIFLIIMQVFYISQLFLVSVSYDFGTLAYSIAYIRFGEDACMYAGNYVFECISTVYLGILIIKVLFSRKQENTRVCYMEDSVLFDKHFGKTLLIITAPFEIWNTIIKLYTIFTSDYLSAHDINSTYFTYYLSNLFFTALIIILSTEISSIKRKRYFILALAYEFLTMWTGTRAMGVLRILMIFFIYYKYINRFKIKDYLKYIPLGVLFFYVMIVIRNSRGYGINLNNLSLSVNGNILLDTLSEFGITFRVVTYVLDTVKDFAGGLSILTSFLAIIPGWTSLFGSELIDKYYTMHALELQNWGSAFVSDLYFDFGYHGGIFACFVFGLIFGFLCRKLNDYYYQHSIRRFSILAYIILEIIMTTRSYIFRLPRDFVFYGVFYVLIYYFSKSLYGKSSNSIH